MGDETDIQRRVRTAIELFETGVAVMRQNLRRKYPDESEEAIDRRLGEWMRTRPGAEYGDGPGRPVPWPRR